MKILIVTNLYPTPEKKTWGIFVKEQVESLQKMYGSSLSIDVYLVNGNTTKLNYLKALFYLPFLVVTKKYTLVHVHYGLTLISVLFVPVPVITTWHGSDILAGLGKKIGRLLSRRSRKSICVSENVKEALGGGVVIPCGIDTTAFNLPMQFPPPNSVVKPLERRLLKILFPSDPHTKVKDYPLFKNVCNCLEKKGFTVRELHLKGIRRTDVPSLFWEADLMLLTSFSEGSPTVVKEAIASKLPFVSVAVGDVAQWCLLIDFGMVINSRDPEKIAISSISLLKSISCRPVLNNSAAVVHFDHANVAKRIGQLYNDLI